MRFGRLVLAALVVSAVGIGMAGPAGADAVTPPGACTASGQWLKGHFTERTEDHGTSDVIDIPRHDVVRWSGHVNGGKLGEKTSRRDIAGSVDVDLPLGQSITVNDWDKTSVKVANRGRHGYNLPVLFAGVKFKLHGHEDENGKQVCSGSVYMKVDGGATSNPLLWASIVGLVVGLGGLLLAGRQVVVQGDPLVEDSGTRTGHGRRVLGAIAGFILGGALGALLLPLGVLPLESIVLIVLPVAGLVVGLAFAWWGPLGSRSEV